MNPASTSPLLLLCFVLLALAGCNPETGALNKSVGPTSSADTPTVMPDTTHDTPARIITLEPSPATSAPEVQNLEELLPVAPAEPLDELIETVSPDGTVSIDFGNRFVRPLSVHIDCKGQLIQSHGDKTVDTLCEAAAGDTQ